MKLVKVNALPATDRRPYPRYRNDIVACLEGFMADPTIRLALIQYDPDEYVDVRSIRSAFGNAVNRNRFPIEVRSINGKVYLIKEPWHK